MLHWDGKLLPDCCGTQKVDRLPIVLSGLNYEQLLAVPKLNSGTGFNQAQSIVGELKRWNVVNNVKGMCFDTAYVNSGVTLLYNYNKTMCSKPKLMLYRHLIFLIDFSC